MVFNESDRMKSGPKMYKIIDSNQPGKRRTFIGGKMIGIHKVSAAFVNVENNTGGPLESLGRICDSGVKN